MKTLLVLLVFCMLLVGFPSLVSAQDSTTAAELKTEQEYMLPYPGLLPDNPLYFLKVTRDRIVSFLISDNLKKAEFNLLQADKRLGGGIGLIDKKNYQLAESTFSKGLNYLEESVVKVEDAKKEGKDIVPLLERMTLSIEKHKEVFKQLEKETPAEFNQHVGNFLKRIEDFEKRVNSLMPKE